MNLKKIIRETLEKTLQENTHFMNVENDAINKHFQRQKSRASIARYSQFTGKDTKPYYITQENGQALFKVFAPTESGLAPIAYLYLHPNKDFTLYTPDAGKADAVHVNPEHRRKGIAMALYDFAEKEAGLNIQPSTVQTPEIKALWKKRKDLEEEEVATRRTQDFPDFYDTLYNPLRKNMAYPPKTGIVTVNDMRETEELDRMLKGKNYSIHLLAKKLASQLGYKDVWPLGTGTVGYAFSIGDEKVMKITPDFSEYSNAKKILNKKTKHLADIYGTYRLTKDLDGIYVIISEQLDFYADRLYDLDDDVTRGIRRLADITKWSMLQKNAGLIFNGVLKDKLTDKYIKEVRDALVKYQLVNDEALWYFDQMIEMMKEMREYKITSTDFGPTNTGLKKNGNIGFYDLGYAKEEMALKGQEDPYGIEVQQERKSK